MATYYNEFDPFAANWLRQLIKAGCLPEGWVDSRPIQEVKPEDLKGYDNCHFFAGIGGWAYAMRLAGIPDDFPIWTGSCPCQAFSTAGKRKGVTDERHLWPVFYELISACKPSIVVGEQVENAIKFGWLDQLHSDLEKLDYSIGASVLNASSLSAPHIRHRLYWGGLRIKDFNVANAPGFEPQHTANESMCSQHHPVISTGLDVANANGARSEQCSGQVDESKDAGECASCNALANAEYDGLDELQKRGGVEQSEGEGRSIELEGRVASRLLQYYVERLQTAGERASPPYSQFWRGCDYRKGRDGKIRPVEPGSFPLAHGVSTRVGRLRGYGNAIVPQVGAVFLESLLMSGAELLMQQQGS